MMSTGDSIITLLGLAVITLVTRGFFLIPKREVPLPGWFHQGLRYAPLAALVAVIVPDVLLLDGVLITSPQNARLVAAIVAVAFYYWRRSLLGTIAVGLLVMVALQRGLGW